jgi:succinate dehydrogenase / fumarate reductase cytochrome b subunit
VNAFSIPWVTAVYVVANLFLGMHLYHGAFSLFQSLGLNHAKYNDKAKGAARAFAFLVTAGNVAMPLAVYLGFVGQQ